MGCSDRRSEPKPSEPMNSGNAHNREERPNYAVIWTWAFLGYLVPLAAGSDMDRGVPRVFSASGNGVRGQRIQLAGK